MKQFNITAVLSIAAETNDSYQKIDMETLKTDHTNYMTTPSYDRIYLIEVLLKSDPRYTSSKSQEAVKKGIKGLLERKAFAFVNIKGVPQNGNII